MIKAHAELQSPHYSEVRSNPFYRLSGQMHEEMLWHDMNHLGEVTERVEVSLPQDQLDRLDQLTYKVSYLHKRLDEKAKYKEYVVEGWGTEGWGGE